MIKPKVSVIIVCRNEARYIADCIQSVISQFESSYGWELIIVDGLSDDNTKQIASEILSATGVRYSILDNPRRTLACGWNIGIRASKGEFVIRPDAHSVLGDNYIKGALATLNKFPDAAGAGGRLITRSKSRTGFVISEALSMKTGVGNSSFRTNSASGFKDTVVYGLYRRELFDKVGFFNESLVRHQDTEFHNRVHMAGFKLYFDNTIHAVYFCRDTLFSLFTQMFRIGFYFSHLFEHKAGSSLQLRHLTPMLFYLILLLLLCLGVFFESTIAMLFILLAFYLSVILAEGFSRMFSGHGFPAIMAALIVPLMHLSYASGTFSGFLRLMLKRSGKQ